MSKTFKKVSPIKYREVLSTIERICMIKNSDEKNEALNDIYMIAHSFVGSCDNPHLDWRKKQEEIKKQLDEAKI